MVVMTMQRSWCEWRQWVLLATVVVVVGTLLLDDVVW
jgi:hypothetical protein